MVPRRNSGLSSTDEDSDDLFVRSAGAVPGPVSTLPGAVAAQTSGASSSHELPPAQAMGSQLSPGTPPLPESLLAAPAEKRHRVVHTLPGRSTARHVPQNPFGLGLRIAHQLCKCSIETASRWPPS